ncbi:Insecticidal toxin complex protein [Formosa maritima]|uniref:Insecticidal toxin complex protein n=2 Tax=Flavobacteriaceae TaxID=49546 RepID=A0A5D0GED7_9FLAO|nr:Insecticidal toxin complex protein [Formosa maritima]TYA56012.1 Insecticidal toxin complex protein [Formosa maritima]
MKSFFYLFFLSLTTISYSKEYKNLKEYHEISGKILLEPSDWLSKDRKNNTLVWQQANEYNLKHNLPAEYLTIKERTDFYLWLYTTLNERDVVWPKMAHFISNKLENINSFPFNMFTRKEVKLYATKGSKTVFNKAFSIIKKLYFSESILNKEDALTWDESIIYKEQYNWLEEIYNGIDAKTLKTIDKMAQGKGIYTFIVPKEVAFSGDLSDKENRYNYAINTLRTYCINNYD